MGKIRLRGRKKGTARVPFLQLCDVSVLGDPLLHFDGEPEGVNAEGNDTQEEPLDVVAEKLSAVSVKAKAVAVNCGVLYVPRFL